MLLRDSLFCQHVHFQVHFTVPERSEQEVVDNDAPSYIVKRGDSNTTDTHFEAEEVIVSGNRAVVLWNYQKMRNGQPWHLRGVDIFTVRDGKVAAKLAYVKG